MPGPPNLNDKLKREQEEGTYTIEYEIGYWNPEKRVVHVYNSLTHSQFKHPPHTHTPIANSHTQT